jgi:cytoplasmic iron level regulating protein YaaA (DUF328/UPF0246 family)
MKKIVLISCVSKKLSCKAQAKDLYISTLFKFNLQFARSLKPDKIFILSAKYGLLNLYTEIQPYNETLNAKSSNEIKQWAEGILISLRNEIDIDNDEVIFLAGEKYRKNLVPFLKNYKVPLQGLPIGKQLQYLKEAIK